MRTYFLLFFLASLGDSINGFGQCSIDVEPSGNPQSTCFNIPFNNSISIQASGSNLSYQWYSNNNASNVGGSSIANEITSSLTPPCNSVGSTYYYCVVSANGSVCDTSVISGGFTVISNNTVGAASSSPTLCINTALTNITHSTTGATGIGTATNLPAGVTAAFAGNTITISGTPTASGTFSYSIPLTGGCGSVTATGTVTVNPVATVTVNSPTICDGQTTTLTATPTVPGGTYSWSNGATTQSINVNPSVTTTYTVNYSTASGCAAPTASGTVTVNPTPTITASSATICVGQSATLTATTNTQSGVFTWNPGGITGSTITVSPLVTTTYTLSYVSGAGCASNNATGTVTVNPVATVTVNSPTICDGNSATLTATPSVPVGTFLWNTGATTASITVNPNTTTVYSVVYTSAAGCVSPSASGTLTVNPTPVVTVSNDTICVGQTGSLTASSSLPNGSFAWNPGGYTTATIQDALQQTTTYTVIFTSNLNCPSAPASGTITVNPSATVNAGLYSPICAGESITLSGLIGGSATSSTWSGGTGQFSNNSNLNTTYFPSPPEVSSGSVILTLTTNDPAGPCIAVNDTVTITINPADFVFANNGDDTLSICSGNETTLFGTGANFYIWSGGIQDSVPFIAQSSGWYEVTGYLSNTCFDNAFVFLSVLPSPDFDLPYDTLICSGSSIILYDSSFNESISWNWGNSAVYDLLIPENSGYLSYEASLQNGCTKSDSINLILITTPSSTILGDTVLCSNSSWVNFSVLNTGNQIEWEVINGQIQGQAYNTIFVNFDSTTIASIIVQESVWGTSCTGSDTIYIALSEGLALEPAQISTLFPGSNILVSDFDYPEMNWGYESKISGNPIYVNQFNQYCEFIPFDTVNYYYWVEVGDGNGCLTKSYFNSPNYASNFEFEEPSMELFPNPTGNLINLKTNLPIFTYKVQTLNGLIVNYGKAEFATSIDLADLADGVYYIHLSYKDRTFVNKIIKINA